MAKTAKKTADTSDLFTDTPAAAARRLSAKAVRGKPAPAGEAYTARDIEVLEGLEPVRRRPGMYIGGTDEKALHHLFAEVIDNAMDEALAGHATTIEVEMTADGFVSVTDNGRGMPVDPHPKFPKKSALEVIMTMLHAGGKFDSKVYETSGGLHGVGVSVTNALSDRMEVEVWRGAGAFPPGVRARNSEEQAGKARPCSQQARHQGPLSSRCANLRRQGGIQACAHFQDGALEGLPVRRRRRFTGGATRRCSRASTTCRSRRRSTSSAASPTSSTAALHGTTLVHPDIFAGKVGKTGAHGAVEWAVAWVADADGFVSSYCNTIPTQDGGTHEAGLRAALTRGIRDHAERAGQGKRAANVTQDDVMIGAGCMLSVFIREPEFQGQTKDRLATVEAQRITEAAIKDNVDHWLAGNPAPREPAARLGGRARRRAAAPPRREGNAAQERDAQAAPARQARRLHQHRRAGLRAVHRRGRLGGRLGQAGARPRQSGRAAAARKNPQRRLGRQGQARRQPAACRSGAGARRRHRRALSRRGPALREDRRDDRRRRRRRAHRLVADHVLLSPDAATDRARAPLSRGAAALSPLATAARRSTRATRRTATSF